ncbi:unnamed protein product [Nesidiocoris tenuis]|uniref:Uncharacterized protein n=1 Tax=Nesidiocoris tenuis TaxID=355587 RepID=A0A6H5HUR2_9HEMI|nr:unnamed protein product [Nesidiocoris tenuis]
MSMDLCFESSFPISRCFISAREAQIIGPQETNSKYNPSYPMALQSSKTLIPSDAPDRDRMRFGASHNSNWLIPSYWHRNLLIFRDSSFGKVVPARSCTWSGYSHKTPSMTVGQIRRRHCPRRSDWLEQSTGRRKTNASDKDADFDRCHLRARRQMGRHLFASLNGHATLRAASAPEGRRSGSCGTGIYLSRAAWVGNAWVGYTQMRKQQANGIGLIRSFWASSTLRIVNHQLAYLSTTGYCPQGALVPFLPFERCPRIKHLGVSNAFSDKRRKERFSDWSLERPHSSRNLIHRTAISGRLQFRSCQTDFSPGSKSRRFHCGKSLDWRTVKHISWDQSPEWLTGRASRHFFMRPMNHNTSKTDRYDKMTVAYCSNAFHFLRATACDSSHGWHIALYDSNWLNDCALCRENPIQLQARAMTRRNPPKCSSHVGFTQKGDRNCVFFLQREPFSKKALGVPNENSSATVAEHRRFRTDAPAQGV